MEEPGPLPSPKMKPSESRGLYSWSHAYAGFAPSFAEAALRVLNVSARQKVLDPFVGSGTSAVTAAAYGCKFIGSDLDPFSALLSKAKSAFNVDAKQVRSILSPKSAGTCDDFNEDARKAFSRPDLEYAAAVFRRIKSRIGLQGQELLKFLIENPEGKASSDLLALVALLIAAKERSSGSRGSNPVWFKRENAAFEESEVSIQECAKALSPGLIDDLGAQSDIMKGSKVSIYNGDFSETGIRARSIDFILTSPPYLNRLDYVVSHLPELTLLSGLSIVEFESLRRRMMGTTKMNIAPATDDRWGNICKDILEKVRTHQSVASSTYYYRFHAQYFSELFRFLGWSKKVMKEGGAGFLVIQDSYYKDIRVPISEIIEEMALNFGISVEVVRTDKRHNHIGAMDPKQRAYVKIKELHEKTLSLRY